MMKKNHLRLRVGEPCGFLYEVNPDFHKVSINDKNAVRLVTLKETQLI